MGAAIAKLPGRKLILTNGSTDHADKVLQRLGMTTVLVVPDGTKDVVREDWELEGRDAAHVDHVTEDLTGFLEKLTPG